MAAHVRDVGREWRGLAPARAEWRRRSPEPPPSRSTTATRAPAAAKARAVAAPIPRAAPVPTLLVALALFWRLGSPVDFDPPATLAAIEAASTRRCCTSCRSSSCSRWRCCAGRRSSPSSSARSPAACSPSWSRPERVAAFADAGRCPPGLALLKGVWAALATGYVSTTGEPAVDQLLTRGGMESMLGTVWLILVALAFGGIVEKAGVLERLIGPVIAAARSVGALVATLVGAAFATNVLASDQYIAVVLPGRMFRGAFAERGLRPGGAVARARRLRHRDLAADPLEQLRRLHGRDPRRRRHLLRPLRLLQPAQSARLDRLRLPRPSDAADCRRRTSTRLAGRPTNPEAKESPHVPGRFDQDAHRRLRPAGARRRRARRSPSRRPPPTSTG